MGADKHEVILLNGLKVGDRSAFSSLYGQYSIQVHRNIFRMVKDEELSKEILQEVFLKVWLNREELDVDKPFKAFLFKVAQNVVYDHFRKVARERTLKDEFLVAVSERYMYADEKIRTKENEMLINKLLDQLPQQRREVYRLCKLEHKSYKEVSQELGISTATISDHITKANKTLREFLLNNKSHLIEFMVLILANTVRS